MQMTSDYRLFIQEDNARLLSIILGEFRNFFFLRTGRVPFLAILSYELLEVVLAFCSVYVRDSKVMSYEWKVCVSKSERAKGTATSTLLFFGIQRSFFFFFFFFFFLFCALLTTDRDEEKNRDDFFIFFTIGLLDFSFFLHEYK